eukprot:3649222-Alexandrium_andersonii.AAC.1
MCIRDRCNPQSAQGPSVLQSASIRNPPCGQLNIASSARSLNCAGPGTASKLVPEALEGCVLRRFSRRFRTPPTKA